MKVLRFMLPTFLSLALVSSAVAQTPEKEIKKTNEKIEACEPASLINPETSEIKTLAEGADSRIEKPFVFVARDAKTFELLKNSVENLPPASTIDWTKNAVIAAFAGTKNTGGYSLAVTNADEKFSVELLSPPQGAIATPALTSAYTIAVVTIGEEKTLNLTISNELKSAAKIYKIASSEFKYSGDVAFREKKFFAGGTIYVTQTGELVTLKFDLSAKGAEREMSLSETASGILKNGKLELLRLGAGSFSENPKPPVKVSGSMNENKLSLIFEPLPRNVADGFSFEGKLEAVKK